MLTLYPGNNNSVILGVVGQKKTIGGPKRRANLSQMAESIMFKKRPCSGSLWSLGTDYNGSVPCSYHDNVVCHLITLSSPYPACSTFEVYLFNNIHKSI